MKMQWTGPPWRFREAGFYHSDDEFGALIVPFVEEGVAAGQPVILGCAHREASLLRSWLGDPGAVTFLAGHGLYATPASAPDESPARPWRIWRSARRRPSATPAGTAAPR